MSHDLHCHRCSRVIGEASRPLKLVGMFEAWGDRCTIEEPRESWRCKSCGWVNVFKAQVPQWRTVETKLDKAGATG